VGIGGGLQPKSTPSFIRDALVFAANDMNFSVSIDAPFAGALVPIAHYRKDRRVQSVMIEVNRRVYMDEESGLKNPNFRQVRDNIRKLIEAAAYVSAPRA
jgi:N-formylglutamate amidohydrolase